ncbi:polysaccharide biosynthesis protein [Eshraghiella crossota]|uniref:Polysaccharide biosynthesis protein n=1 Tax=Eshraghiella crossota DSM 2876 TaxID=511680 RepID=D4S2I8_9FIRM|nr:polysaccharide biosynthesis protein [Butyrivibrio crossotus]EFF67443.1 polysaccharide biosynthesis protein [Butyrivibrio crossotus DSM 2876]UWO51198.1 polysaccharide biosynthesis protein [Butyrivibrio crossotus]
MDDKTSGKHIIKQGTILAAASVISRIIGMLYRSPMAAVIGDKGNGLYSFAFEIYSIALILSSYSMPLAVSKLLSARFAKKEYKNADKIYKFAYIFAAVSGMVMALILFFGAGTIERLSGHEGLALPLKVLAPTVFVVALAGTIRGFFQSRNTMMPTAVSQLAEQIINAIVSIVAAVILVRFAANEFDKARYGAAGGTIGTLFGALSSLMFLIFLFVIYKPRMKKHLSHDKVGVTVSNEEVLKLIVATIVPVILSQTVYQSIGVVDGFMFGNLYKGSDSTALYGIYSSKYRLMVNVPNAISSALASSMIPSLVSLYTLKNFVEFRARLKTSVKFNMIIAFPCAFGISALSGMIMKLLFPTTDTVISGRMLMYGSVAVLFYALSTVTNAALQGMDRMRLPVRHAAISLLIHIPLMVILLKFTKLGAHALVIGNIIYPLIVCALNWASVARYANYRQEVKTTFIIPLLASSVMWIETFCLSRLMAKVLPVNYVTNALITIICIVNACLVYFIMLFVLKGVTREELKEFPMGGRMAKFADKLKIKF